jgi:glycosyltransferase domain-containing protein
MSPAARSRYTLLIPTYNRPAYFRSLLGYLSARRFEYPIRVLDSSAEPALSENRESVDRSGLDIAHHIYDPAINVGDKIARGTQLVETPYCSFCADDDILFTRDLDRYLDFLDANSAFVGAHGYYVNFKPGDDFALANTVYSAPSIAGDDALKRIVEQMRDYQAVFYAIYRTGVMQFVLSQFGRVQSLWAGELLSSSLTLVSGGVYRAQDVFMARNTNPSIATEGWHPHHFLAIEPAQLLREYADYRAVTLEHLAADAHCRARYQPEQMQRVFDLVHLKYLAPMLSPVFMDYLIQQSMRSDTTPRQIIDSLWNVRPSDDGSGGLRRHLVRATALWERYAAGLPEYLRRMASLYVGLRFGEKLDVSLTPAVRKMTVRRTTRDGHSRRYLLARGFVSQKLSDERRIGSPHVADIVEHLDDYV